MENREKKGTRLWEKGEWIKQTLQNESATNIVKEYLKEEGTCYKQVSERGENRRKSYKSTDNNR